MTPQMTLEGHHVDVPEFEDIADQVTGNEYSLERPEQPATIRRTSDWFLEAKRQFRAIRQLSAGWDSHGSARPNRSTVDSGEHLLQVLAFAESDLSKPHIAPTRSGGVQFHWESGRRYFQIELLDPQTAEFYYVDEDAQCETEGQLHAGDTLEQVLRLVRSVERRR